ncbi:MAG: hypothetical protein ACOCYQ_03415 [Alkalispirochaeta sp.]
MSVSPLHVILTVLLLLAVPGFVIPQTPISDILDRSGWNREQQRRAESILDDATSEELSAEAIELRLREGIAKRVDPERVLSVAADELSILRRAQALVETASAEASAANGNDRDVLLERTVTLLRSGYEAAEITRLLRLSGGPGGGNRSATAGSDLAETYRAVTALHAAVIEQGVQRGAAMDLVTAAIAANVPATDLPRVASLLTVAARSGYGPDRATGIIVESLDAGRSIPEITRQLGR